MKHTLQSEIAFLKSLGTKDTLWISKAELLKEPVLDFSNFRGSCYNCGVEFLLEVSTRTDTSAGGMYVFGVCIPEHKIKIDDEEFCCGSLKLPAVVDRKCVACNWSYRVTSPGSVMFPHYHPKTNQICPDSLTKNWIKRKH